MCNFKLKQQLIKKSILLNFLIVCSLLISEKALAVWDRNSCFVDDGSASNIAKENSVKIYFKFFEYEKTEGIQNSYLKRIEIHYSTNSGKTYKRLMSASTENQISKTWAWINIYDKQAGSKIELSLLPYNQTKPVRMSWYEGSNQRLDVNTNSINKFQTWIGVYWFLIDDQNYTTHIRITGTWYNLKEKKSDYIYLIYDITPNDENMYSNSLNFYNSSPKQEIGTVAKNNTKKAYKKANAIVVKGAFNETIRVYTTLGKLIKSVVADCDLLQIPLPSSQHYIVNIGQENYRVKL